MKLLRLILIAIAAAPLAAGCVALEQDRPAWTAPEGFNVIHAAATRSPYRFVIMPEGFSEDELAPGGLFETTAARIRDAVFSEEPLCRMTDLCEVATYVPSGYRTGAPTFSVVKRTDANIIDWNGAAVSAATAECLPASSVPFSTVIILCRDERRMGYSITHLKPGLRSASVCAVGLCRDRNSGPDELRRMVLHEAVGHCTGLLDDEYTSAATFSNRESIETLHGLGAALNVSLEAGRTPWDKYIGLEGYPDTGVFEGASNCSSGIWRSSQDSAMVYAPDGSSAFNAISRECIHRRVCTAAGLAWDWESFLRFDALRTRAAGH